MTRVHPEALQVADRWHLMENASAAFLDVVRRAASAPVMLTDLCRRSIVDGWDRSYAGNFGFDA